MRIIGGQYGKRPVHPPKNLPVRPTTDLAKESLFNILRNKTDFTGKHALDLYSGTGSISYEFASRGCEKVVAVDLNFDCIRFIKKTAAFFEMNQLTAIRSDARRFLKTTPLHFDIVFADPPYQLKELDEVLEIIFDRQLLNPQGLLILEHPGEDNFSEHPGFLELRRYGQVNFSFFQAS